MFISGFRVPQLTANQQIEYKISRLKDALHAASTAGNKLGYDHFTFLVSSVFCFVLFTVSLSTTTYKDVMFTFNVNNQRSVQN